jgi:hypothetical protein
MVFLLKWQHQVRGGNMILSDEQYWCLMHVQSTSFWVATFMGCQHTQTIEVVICCLPSNWTWKTTPHPTVTSYAFSSTEVFRLSGSEWWATEYWSGGMLLHVFVICVSYHCPAHLWARQGRQQRDACSLLMLRNFKWSLLVRSIIFSLLFIAKALFVLVGSSFWAVWDLSFPPTTDGSRSTPPK